MKLGSVLSLFLFLISFNLAFAVEDSPKKAGLNSVRRKNKKTFDLRPEGSSDLLSLENHEKPRIPEGLGPTKNKPFDIHENTLHLQMREQMLESQRLSLQSMQGFLRNGNTVGGPPSGILDPTRMNFESSF